MSMYLEFEPHSWYYGFAIKKDPDWNDPCQFEWYGDEQRQCIVHGVGVGRYDLICKEYAPKWSAFTDDGNTYSIVKLHSTTLPGIKREIIKYWFRDGGKHVPVFYEKKLLKSKEALGV